MPKPLKRVLEYIFNRLYPILKPACVQQTLRAIGLKFPYHRFAEKLQYQGLVDFTVNGKKLLMRSHNNFIEVTIFWYGVFGIWEAEQLRLWSKLVSQADVVLDIGANNGIYSLIAGTNEQARVFAFEPVPVVRELLEENIALNKSAITVVDRVVGDAVGTATLYIPRQGWVDVASINKDFAEHFVTKDTMQELSCAMTTVDAFLTEQGVGHEARVVAKIDVEGAEARVLTGMQETFKRPHFSFTAELLDADFFATCARLIPPDYRSYAIDEKAGTVVPCTGFVPGVGNYFFTKEPLADLPW